MNSSASLAKLRLLPSRACSYSVLKWTNDKSIRLPETSITHNLSTSSVYAASQAADGTSQEFPPNSSLQLKFVHNRNPRNLEKLRIGHKPEGWTLEKEGRCFWNKLTFELTGKHINAKVEHHTGHVPLTASSKEWCIRKFLYSTKDVCAARAVGRVLARRCIEIGISELYTTYTAEDRRTTKLDEFLKAFEDEGIALTEPGLYKRPTFLNDDVLDEKSWEVFEDIVVKDFPTNLKK